MFDRNHLNVISSVMPNSIRNPGAIEIVMPNRQKLLVISGEVEIDPPFKSDSTTSILTRLISVDAHRGLPLDAEVLGSTVQVGLSNIHNSQQAFNTRWLVSSPSVSAVNSVLVLTFTVGGQDVDSFISSVSFHASVRLKSTTYPARASAGFVDATKPKKKQAKKKVAIKKSASRRS